MSWIYCCHIRSVRTESFARRSVVQHESLQAAELHGQVQTKEEALLRSKDQNSQKNSNMVKERQQLTDQVSETS